MRLTRDEALRRAADADHGILGTLRPGHGPDLVPAVFAIHGEWLAVPIDRVKDKSTAHLQRTRNLAADPHATFLVEGWDRVDWSRLWWVRLRLEHGALDGASRDATHATLEAALRRRYPQYAAAPFAALLIFRIIEATGWIAGAGDHRELVV